MVIKNNSHFYLLFIHQFIKYPYQKDKKHLAIVQADARPVMPISFR